MKLGFWPCLLICAPFLFQTPGSEVSVRASKQSLDLDVKNHVERAMEMLKEHLSNGCGSKKKTVMKAVETGEGNRQVNFFTQEKGDLEDIALTYDLQWAKQRLEEILLQAHLQSDKLTVVHDDIQVLIFRIRPGDFRGLNISSATLMPNTSVNVQPRHSMYFPAELVEKTPGVAGKEMQLSCIYLKASCLFEDGKNRSLVNNDILGATLGNISIANLSQPVEIKFWHNHSLANSTLTCVFWLEGRDIGIGGWSQDGCTTDTSQEGIVLCRCNHLTYFAVLLESSPTIVDEVLLASLIYITDIGCSISAIACLVTIFLHIFWRHTLHDVAGKIHGNLLGALWLLNTMFLASKLQPLMDSLGLCKAAAISLHYALLSCLTWMAIEGFHLYVLIIRVYNSYIPHYLLKLCSVGWGIPGLAVLLVFMSNRSTYGIHTVETSPDYQSSQMCWITSPVVHHLNLLYFSATMLFNVVVLARVLWTLRQLRSSFPHRDRTSSHKDIVTVLGLTGLLGVTWTPAFLFFQVFSILRIIFFTVMNSLQGLLICLWYWAFRCHSQKDASAGNSHCSQPHVAGEADGWKDTDGRHEDFLGAGQRDQDTVAHSCSP